MDMPRQSVIERLGSRRMRPQYAPPAQTMRANFVIERMAGASPFCKGGGTSVPGVFRREPPTATAAANITKVNLAISLGCIEKPPRPIQRLDPRRVMPRPGMNTRVSKTRPRR